MAEKQAYSQQLTATQREQGKHNIRRFVTLNGISVAFLMNDLLILYGIRNGLADPQLAVLASFIHLTMPFMLIGKEVTRRVGAARTWGMGWFFRYVSASIMIIAPFLHGLTPQWSIAAVVLTGGFGFALFRSIGLVGNSPLIGEVTTPRDRGKFIANNWVRSQTTYFASMVAVVLIMRFVDALWVYQLVIGTGCLVGFYASRQLVKVPESSVPSQSAQKPIRQALHLLWKRILYRRMLFAWAAAFCSFALVIPFSVITIKNGYGISDYFALTFTLLVIAGGIVSSLINSAILDRVGPRPLFIIYASGFFPVAAYWAFAPEHFYIIPVGIAFFLAGFCKTGIIVTSNHYFLSAVEDKDRVVTSLFIRMASGAAAGFAASVGGGTILKVLETSAITGLDIYRTYFRIIICLLIPFTLIVGNLKTLKEWKVRNILGLIFSPRDLMALFVMSRMDSSEDSQTDVNHVERLGKIASGLSESTLRSFLESPRLSVRVHALHALRQINFGNKTASALINEVQQGEYTTAWVAAEILGERRIREAIPYLREGLGSEDQFLKGKCMVALVRLDDSESYAMIKTLFREARNPRIIIHGANALVEMNDYQNVELLLSKTDDPQLQTPVYDELLTAIATMCGCGEQVYRFLREYNRSRKEALSLIETSLETIRNRTAMTLDPEIIESDTLPARLLEPLIEYARRIEETYIHPLYTYLLAHQGTSIHAKLFSCIALILTRHTRIHGMVYPFDQ
jgi:hypothetical protein